MKEINTVFVHSNVHNQLAWKNLNEMILQGMLDSPAPNYTIKGEHITMENFLETTKKSEAGLIVFTSESLDIEISNARIKKIFKTIRDYYWNQDWYAMPGCDTSVAQRLGIFYEGKNKSSFKELIKGEYSC